LKVLTQKNNRKKRLDENDKDENPKQKKKTKIDVCNPFHLFK
jgi:hypothetical protein